MHLLTLLSKKFCTTLYSQFDHIKQHTVSMSRHQRKSSTSYRRPQIPNTTTPVDPINICVSVCSEHYPLPITKLRQGLHWHTTAIQSQVIYVFANKTWILRPTVVELLLLKLLLANEIIHNYIHFLFILMFNFCNIPWTSNFAF